MKYVTFFICTVFKNTSDKINYRLEKATRSTRVFTSMLYRKGHFIAEQTDCCTQLKPSYLSPNKTISSYNHSNDIRKKLKFFVCHAFFKDFVYLILNEQQAQ